MVMKIKLLYVVVVVACQKQKSTGGGSKEHNVLSEYGYSTECPNLM